MKARLLVGLVGVLCASTLCGAKVGIPENVKVSVQKDILERSNSKIYSRTYLDALDPKLLTALYKD